LEKYRLYKPNILISTVTRLGIKPMDSMMNTCFEAGVVIGTDCTGSYNPTTIRSRPRSLIVTTHMLRKGLVSPHVISKEMLQINKQFSTCRKTNNSQPADKQTILNLQKNKQFSTLRIVCLSAG
jgi:hypothetical protein